MWRVLIVYYVGKMEKKNRSDLRIFICLLGIFNSTLFYFFDSNFPGMSVF